MKKKFTKRSLALLLAALVLLGIGGFGTAWAASPAIRGEYYNAWFYLNHLQVHLLENGRDVCGGHNDLNGSAKISGQLVQYLGYESKSKLGEVEPGRKYKEEIAARNGSDIPIFLRLTMRKYWIDTATGEKVSNLSPNRIRLTYGDQAYNAGAWQINPAETSTESATYYYTTTLGAGADTAPLFDTLVIDDEVAQIEEVTTRTEGNKTIYKYKYHYDGYAFFIEADVQAIQTHNVMDAIHSQWGVNNVTATFTAKQAVGENGKKIEVGTGTLSVG